MVYHNDSVISIFAASGISCKVYVELDDLYTIVNPLHSKLLSSLDINGGSKPVVEYNPQQGT